MKTNYQQKKDAAREKAILWQLAESDKPMSYFDLADIGNYFYNIGRRFGLLREFRENGIPC